MRESKARRGWGALVAGLILTIAGAGVIIYSVWTTGTLPLNDTTFIGAGVFGVGAAAGAIGIDRGEKK